MKINILRSFFIVFTIFVSVVTATAQGGKSSASTSIKSPAHPTYRLLANYDYVMASPGELNSYRSQYLWNGTTASLGTFSNMNGFTVGAGYLLDLFGPGYIGLEYSRGLQELTNTYVPPGTFNVQDSFDYDTVYALYDLIYNRGSNQSYELGGGIGYALKYQFHSVLNAAGGTTEEVIWQANPLVLKVRAHYSYHFSNYIRLRAGATYEYATSSVTSDSTHQTLAITTGQTLRNATSGQDVKVDISGLRLNAGVVVTF